MAPVTWTVKYGNTSSTSMANYGTSTATDCIMWPTMQSFVEMLPPSVIPAKQASYELPDGAKLIMDDDGNYHIDDTDAKVIYQANRVRPFSPHINASDLVAEFITHVGTLGVRRADVLHLPLNLFIAWLIIEAAERDSDPIPPGIVPIRSDPAVHMAARPRCLKCGRFVRRLHFRNRFPYCSPKHATKYLQRSC